MEILLGENIWNKVNVGGNIENGLMADSYNSNGNITYDKKTPWCSAFVNYCLGTTGTDGTKSALAYSFKGYGQNLGNDTPVYCSIAVMNYFYVGFVVGTNKDGRVTLLGGNQGNAVNLSPNGQSAVIKYVYPSGQTPTTLALPQYNLQGRSLTNATSR